MTNRHYAYLRWFPKDYAGDPLVRGMTKAQDLAYRRLLDCSWELGPLPEQPERLAALIGYSPAEFGEAWTYPLTECWRMNGSGLINARLERERKLTREFSKKQSDRASSGWKRAKAQQKKEDTGNAAAKPRHNRGMPRLCPPSPSPSPSPDQDLLPIDPRNSAAKPEASPPRARKQKVIWDEKEESCVAVDEKWKTKFREHWKTEFGEELYEKRLVQANNWLANPNRADRRSENSRLDEFLWNWMVSTRR